MVKEKSDKWKSKILAYTLKNAISHQGKAQEGSVISGLFAEGLEKKEVKSVIEEVKKTVSDISQLSVEEQQKRFSEYEESISHRTEREGLPELPKAEKGVIMRFSPSASGVMHIGHILTGMPTSLYVKKYGGKFYLRIEDTDPDKIDPESYTSMPRDADWIFGNVTEWYAQSDRIPKYYKFAEDIIKKRAGYVCTCNPEEFKELIKESKPCKCRKNSIKENFKRWNKMLDKKGFKEGQAVLRFKSDLKNPNPAFRDFPLARIKETPHKRQDKKYRVWPLMNLCVSLDDMEFKITHIIRAKEHRDNATRQAMIFKVFKKKVPETLFLGRYKFEELPISKSAMKQMIQEGIFSGWDDLRIPLARNFRKRGYQPKAFEEMAIQRGISEVDKVISQKDFFEVLDNFNRKILHEIAVKAEFTVSEKGNFMMVMADNSEVKIKSKISPKPGEIYHFPGFGYAKYNEDKKFYFAHK
ncbi:MAG: hypothetical protein KKB21_04185 [Nanoarchaeota archaeon]|nr:hypothetical protein [Nanoarchaeota archaeon]